MERRGLFTSKDVLEHHKEYKLFVTLDYEEKPLSLKKIFAVEHVYTWFNGETKRFIPLLIILPNYEDTIEDYFKTKTKSVGNVIRKMKIYDYTSKFPNYPLLIQGTTIRNGHEVHRKWFEANEIVSFIESGTYCIVFSYDETKKPIESLVEYSRFAKRLTGISFSNWEEYLDSKEKKKKRKRDGL